MLEDRTVERAVHKEGLLGGVARRDDEGGRAGEFVREEVFEPKLCVRLQ